MATAASIVDDLASIVGRAHAATADVRRFTVDGAQPSTVVRPHSEEQVAEVIRYANTAGLAVIPWGGGTSMRTGNTPARYDIALSLDRMAQVIEHEPADLTATCQAGITLSRLQEALGAAGQVAPFERCLPPTSTVGGALAANSSGASRQTTGTPRDFTIGMRVVTGDGLIVRAGGKVVKNVAGYDLCKLFAGSRGTLGIIVEATFKLAPTEAPQAGILPMRSIEDACAAAADLHRRGLLHACVVANAAGAADLGLPADGATPFYIDSVRPLVETAAVAGPAAVEHPSLQNPVALRERLSIVRCELEARASVLPSTVAAIVAQAGRIVPDVRAFAQPVTGDVRLAFPDVGEGLAGLARIRDTVASAGGSMVLESCPPEAKRELDVFGSPPVAFSLMQAVKRQFDPNFVLSPGRFVGRL